MYYNYMKRKKQNGKMNGDVINMIVKIDNLVKRYGSFTAVDNLSLEIEKGQIFGLLGPNGSGKTTTINCMLSLLEYDRGNITIFGKEMSPKAYDLKRDIGIVMQNVAVFNELTVYENIDYFCGLYVKDKAKRKKMVEEAIEFTGLQDFVKFFPGKLSGGLLRRLNIACGIAHKPKLIILDEPTVAVDPQSRNSILEGIEKLNKAGATIVYTSHYMEEVEQLCTKIAIIDKGKVIAAGTKEELKEMVGVHEKISIEILGADGEGINQIAKEIEEMKAVAAISVNGRYLNIKSKKGEHLLASLLYFLQERNIAVGNVTSEEPTLNDVFLEITGKELRDNV